MKHLTEYNDPAAIRALADEIEKISKRPARIMEVCGGQTHSILRHALDTLLPPHIQLLHGPGCPVCVTPSAYIDHAIAIAARPDTILCTFGDLLRVPSNASGDLYAAKARGADIRMITSPLQAIDLAQENPKKQIIHLAIGFETTIPANAMLAFLAKERGLKNVSLLVSQFLVPPILRAICVDPETAPDAFLAAGHVCAVTGSDPYIPLAKELNRPIAITGFEPADILLGVLDAIRLLESGEADMVNSYPRVVHPAGNPEALRVIDQVFETSDREWRGLGVVPMSGLSLRAEYSDQNTAEKFPFENYGVYKQHNGKIDCPAADILLGKMEPTACPHFGSRCTPDHPLGAPMVSPEGPCAAFFLHRR